MGRPPTPQPARDRAKALYLEGRSPAEIARALLAEFGLTVSDRTVRGWAAQGRWAADLLKARQTPENLEREIANLAAKPRQTYRDTQRIAMLTKALERLRKVRRPAAPRPVVVRQIAADLERKAREDFGLYPYQSRFVFSDARFALRLKSRQTGFTHAVALKAVLKAMAGREQVCVSASFRQVANLRRYIEKHLEKLDVPIATSEKETLIPAGGAPIHVLPPNPATVQGFTGDVIFDEFAWTRRQKLLWEAVVPTITAVGGTVDVISTPFVPGSFFWKLATNHEGRWGQFERETITIHDAVNEGMVLPGGVEELRGLFEPDSWAMMYLCQWAEDGSALLSWKDLEAAASDLDFREGYHGLVWVGVDVGRVNDRTVIVIIGRLADGRHVVLDWIELRNAAYDEQFAAALDTARLYHLVRGNVDSTGIGDGLAERLSQAAPGVWFKRHFTAPYKERIALNLSGMIKDKGLIIPNDPAFMAHLHAVKKIAGTNSIRYDATRDETTGHADGFWATALAADGLGARGGVSLECEVWG